jgi:hypothetical protein
MSRDPSFAVNASVVWTAAIEKAPLLKEACLRLLERSRAAS